jgi:hypothetical protein
MEIQDWIDRAKEIYKLLDEALSMGDIKMDYVMRTGFISWLNGSDERIERYLKGDDLQGLVLDYIDEITREDEVNDDEMELNEQEDNLDVRTNELG